MVEITMGISIHRGESRLHRCHQLREMHAEHPEAEDSLVDIVPRSLAAKTHSGDSGYGTMSAASTSHGLGHAMSAYAETVMSYAAGDRTVKIPPLSSGAKQGKPFDCIVCGKKVKFTSSRMWK